MSSWQPRICAVGPNPWDRRFRGSGLVEVFCDACSKALDVYSPSIPPIDRPSQRAAVAGLYDADGPRADVTFSRQAGHACWVSARDASWSSVIGVRSDRTLSSQRGRQNGRSDVVAKTVVLQRLCCRTQKAMRTDSRSIEVRHRSLREPIWRLQR